MQSHWNTRPGKRQPKWCAVRKQALLAPQRCPHRRKNTNTGKGEPMASLRRMVKKKERKKKKKVTTLPMHFLCVKLKVKVLVAQLCLTLSDPMDCSSPGSSVHGISQARALEWISIFFSRGSSLPRNWTQVSRIAGRFSTSWATRDPKEFLKWLYKSTLTWTVCENQTVLYPHHHLILCPLYFNHFSDYFNFHILNHSWSWACVYWLFVYFLLRCVKYFFELAFY